MNPTNPPLLRRTMLVLAALAALAVAPARAHHGRDFLLSQTAELPHPGQLFLVPRLDLLEADEHEIELEPSLLYGWNRRLAVEVHAHFARPEGGDLEYESVAPSLHLRLTPPGRDWGLALSVEYERVDAGGHGADGHPEEEHLAAGVLVRAHGTEPHGEPAPDDRVEARLALSGRHAGTLFALNLVAAEVQRAGAELEWGYSAGLRRAFGERTAWGVELQGDLEGADTHEALLALYLDLSPRWSVNFGAGTGLGEAGPDLAVRSAIVFRLR